MKLVLNVKHAIGTGMEFCYKYRGEYERCESLEAILFSNLWYDSYRKIYEYDTRYLLSDGTLIHYYPELNTFFSWECSNFKITPERQKEVSLEILTKFDHGIKVYFKDGENKTMAEIDDIRVKIFQESTEICYLIKYRNKDYSWIFTRQIKEAAEILRTDTDKLIEKLTDDEKNLLKEVLYKVVNEDELDVCV